MHIIVTREDVAKYGLQGLVDPREDASMTLDQLMGLLGHGPVTRPGLAVAQDNPLAALWVETLRLRARIDAVAVKLPKAIADNLDNYRDQLGSVACAVSTALAWDLEAKASEAEGPQAGYDLSRLVADAKDLQARAVPILGGLFDEMNEKKDDSDPGPWLPVILNRMWCDWTPKLLEDIAADQQDGAEAAWRKQALERLREPETASA